MTLADVPVVFMYEQPDGRFRWVVYGDDCPHGDVGVGELKPGWTFFSARVLFLREFREALAMALRAETAG